MSAYHSLILFSQVSFKPLFLTDISMRATTFSADNLERQVLRSGDYFQLQVEASGGRVEWMKDGETVQKVVQPYCDRVGKLVNVDQPDRTQLLEPGTYPPSRPTQPWEDFIPTEQHFPPNRCQSFLGGRCQVLNIKNHIQIFVSAENIFAGEGRRSLPSQGGVFSGGILLLAHHCGG